MITDHAETVFFKHYVLRPTNTKTRGFMDLSDCVGFGLELLAWMYSRGSMMGEFFVVRPGDNSMEVGEVLFTDEDDSVDFVNKFLPNFDRPIHVEGNYWMDAWPCMDEWLYHMEKSGAPDTLWAYEIDQEHSDLIFETPGCDSGTLSVEGIQLWLSLRQIPFKSRFYYWDHLFRFESEADMVIFAVYMDDWKRKYAD